MRKIFNFLQPDYKKYIKKKMSLVRQGEIKIRQRPITLSTRIDDFYISKTPITWKEILKSDVFNKKHSELPQRVRLETRKMPYLGLSWEIAIYFCNWLSEKYNLIKRYESIENFKKEKKWRLKKRAELQKEIYGSSKKAGFRLPTEAEYALSMKRKINNVNIKELEKEFKKDINTKEMAIGKYGEYAGKQDIYNLFGPWAEWLDDCYWSNLNDYILSLNPTSPNYSRSGVEKNDLKNILQKLKTEKLEVNNEMYKTTKSNYPVNEKHQIEPLLYKLQFVERYLPKSEEYGNMLRDIKNLLKRVESEIYGSGKMKEDTLIELMAYLKRVSEKCRSKLQRATSVYNLKRDVEKKIIKQIETAIKIENNSIEDINKYFELTKEKHKGHWLFDDKVNVNTTKLDDIFKKQYGSSNMISAPNHHRVEFSNSHFKERTIIKSDRIFNLNFEGLDIVEGNRQDEEVENISFRVVLEKNI